MAKGKGQSGGRAKNASRSAGTTEEAAASSQMTSAAAADVPVEKARASAPAAAGGNDTVLWAVVALIVVAAIGAFYALGDWSALLRVIMLLIALGVALFVAGKTRVGGSAFEFVKDSRVELRKVVWPAKQETLQTTGLILVVTVIVSIFIWILDTGLGALVKMLIGGTA